MSENFEYGITSTGFNPKGIDIIEEEMQLLLKEYFGENVDLTQTSPLWRMSQVQGAQASKLWIQAEQNFYNCFILTAEGVSLDLIGEDIGLERKPAIEAGVTLKIFKNTSSAVTIPINSLFQTLEGVIFYTSEEITIPSGDPSTTTGEVLVYATQAGLSGNVASGTITLPTSPISGVASSINESSASGGEDAETDTNYRKRLRSYVRSTWTAEAIRSSALNIEGVSNVKIIEEATSYKCLIVPQVAFTPELQAEVELAIEKVTPVTVEFSVIESETILIEVSANVVLESTIDIPTAETNAGAEIDTYIKNLEIDDDVLKSKVIQAIMNVIGIINIYNVSLSPRASEEKHTYTTGTLIYALNYVTGDYLHEITGIVSGSPHTFISGTDFQLLTSPARIQWLSVTLPDNNTEFKVTYSFPANAIGDVEIRQENIAKFSRVTFT